MKIVNYLIFLSILCFVGLNWCGCRGSVTGNGKISTVSSSDNTSKGSGEAVQYSYEIKKVYPHDQKSYTQGLYWHDGYLWEGTGQNGESALKKVDLITGKAVEAVALDEKYFGEGIALLNGNIYQLTWLNQTGFVYDAETLEKKGEFRYSGEGWGITTDGELLYMSNGTHEIWVMDPEGFTRKSIIKVQMGNRRIPYLNELEWIEGRLWANVYGSDLIVIINPGSGQVEGVLDCTGLLPASERTPDTDVLNGIAYDDESGRIFVTGKNWSKLFEIEIKEK